MGCPWPRRRRPPSRTTTCRRAAGRSSSRTGARTGAPSSPSRTPRCVETARGSRGRRVRRRRRRPPDPHDGRPRPRDRPRRHHDRAPPLLGRDGPRRRRLRAGSRSTASASTSAPGDSRAPPLLGLAPHRFDDEGTAPAALHDLLQRADARDDGHVGPRGRRARRRSRPSRPGRRSLAGVDGDDPYARRLRRVARQQDERRSGRLHTSWDSLELLQTPRGTRTTFLLDKAIGYQASGITMAMFEIGPGRGQSMHRHPGEAWLYVLEGKGHSYLGTEPEGGEDHPWKKGDLIVVDHFLWHQHFNDDPDNTAKVVRIHMFDSLLETMRVLLRSAGALRGAAGPHPRRAGRRRLDHRVARASSAPPGPEAGAELGSAGSDVSPGDRGGPRAAGRPSRRARGTASSPRPGLKDRLLGDRAADPAARPRAGSAQRRCRTGCDPAVRPARHR